MEYDGEKLSELSHVDFGDDRVVRNPRPSSHSSRTSATHFPSGRPWQVLNSNAPSSRCPSSPSLSHPVSCPIPQPILPDVVNITPAHQLTATRKGMWAEMCPSLALHNSHTSPRDSGPRHRWGSAPYQATRLSSARPLRASKFAFLAPPRHFLVPRSFRTALLPPENLSSSLHHNHSQSFLGSR
jgi:hypothetical protein